MGPKVLDIYHRTVTNDNSFHELQSDGQIELVIVKATEGLHFVDDKNAEYSNRTNSIREHSCGMICL
jgi:hypothetical protein